jgi:hypothetical protein
MSSQFVGKHQALLTGRVTAQANFAKPIALMLSLLVVKYLSTFNRKYYTPNPKGRPDFHISDLEAWNAEGAKILLEFLGDDKACNALLAIE